MIRLASILVGVGLTGWLAGCEPMGQGEEPPADPAAPVSVAIDSARGTESAEKQVQLDGHVTGCQVRPPFMLDLDIPEGARVSTSTPGLLGFNILMHDSAQGRIRPLTHDSWKAVGNLGQFTYDRDGNIYVVPVPLTSLEVNPPGDQNKVHIIDAKSGRMSEFIDLPAPRPIDTRNPFGTIGLAYDCETHSLYVSSLAGSDPTEETGTVFQISIEDGQVKSRLDGIDVLGLDVFRSARGKRLYFGSARQPEVLSVALDGTGAFIGEQRYEFDLLGLGLPGNFRAQKLRFRPGNRLELKSLPFAYSLRIIEAEEVENLVLVQSKAGSWLAHATN